MQPPRTLARRRAMWALALLIPLVLIGIGIFRSVWSFRPAGPAVAMTFDISSVGRKLVFNGNGQGGSDLYLLDLQTWKVTRLTDTPAAETDPVFAADGQSIVYSESNVGHEGSSIVSYSFATGKTHRLTFPEPSYSDRLPACSHDGKRIAFSRAKLAPPIGFGGAGSEGWDLYTMKSDGSNIQRVTSTRYFSLYAPVYCENDRKLLYSGTIFGESDVTDRLYSVPADGSGPPELIDAAECAYPSLSPDGKHIAVISDRKHDFAYDVLIMQLDGKDARSLSVTSYSTYNRYPRFTQDGKRIFFIGSPGDRNALLSSVSLDGGRPLEETTGVLFETPLQWKR